MNASDTVSPPIDNTSASEETIALVAGEPLTTLPKDLYIPPDALEVFLETFEGPLDLLLYLIKQQNLDIRDIPVAKITEQYMEYLALMQQLRLELAAEYLVMAAMLAEIKSRMLLPRPRESEENDTDPRAELVRRLQEYERFKQAAIELDELPRLEREIFPSNVDPGDYKAQQPRPDVDMQELLIALRDVLERAAHFDHHHVQREPLSVRERMSQILERLSQHEFTAFNNLFLLEEGRLGVVVTFLATLELIRETLVELVQVEPFAPIYLRAQL